jgi:predicted ATPase
MKYFRDFVRTKGRDQTALNTRAVSLARQLGARVPNAEAHHLLAPIYNSFTEGFGTPDLLDAKALMNQLS